MKRSICWAVCFVMLASCDASPVLPAAKTTSSPAPIETESGAPGTVAMGCSRAPLPPRNTEIDTGLDRESQLLTVSWSEAGVNRSSTVRYTRGNCMWHDNRRWRDLIGHVLTAGRPGRARKTYVVTDCFEATTEPPRITLACGDNGFRGHHLTWNEWGLKRAEGRGRFYLRCQPAQCDGEHISERKTQGSIVLVERKFCIGLERYVFWSGEVVLDNAIDRQRRFHIYPGCPASGGSG